MKFYGNERLIEGRQTPPETHYFKMEYEWIKPVVKISRSGRVLAAFPDIAAAARAAGVEAKVMKAWVLQNQFKKGGTWMFKENI